MFRYSLLYFASFCFAKPILPRAIDLDHNGIADYCIDNRDGTHKCLENNKWVVVTDSATSTSISARISSHTPTITPTSSVQPPPMPTAAVKLPEPNTFKQDKDVKWSVEYVGDIGYTGSLANKGVNGDKCRSSKLGDKIIWNCGDMMCGNDLRSCGFAMGPAFYGTDSVMTINTDGVDSMQNHEFVQPWVGDATPQAPQSQWGMDTSNVAAINDTHGVAYAWEIWRGAEDKSYVDRGNAVALVTLGPTAPVAQRVGPLLTGPEKVQLGLLAIMRDGDYIYIYSQGGPSNLTVNRVAASDDVFDSTKYEALEYGTNSWSQAIPSQSDVRYGMTTANKDGKFGCAVYGSVFYNNYLRKYTIICNIFQSFVNMYTSDTPYGPWSSEYSLLSGWTGYGSMAHPHFSPGGSHKEFYFSQGPNSKFNMFKVTFNY